MAKTAFPFDAERFAHRTEARVEEVRRACLAYRDRWHEITGSLGINERWLRAFCSGQIKSPQATRFLLIERWLVHIRALYAPTT